MDQRPNCRDHEAGGLQISADPICVLRLRPLFKTSHKIGILGGYMPLVLFGPFQYPSPSKKNMFP